jgi:heterodisulfide reductase subunit C
MSGLKQIAARRGLPAHRYSRLFYREFIENVRRHGRLREMEFMTRYFAAMKNPLLPFRFAVLGLKLMARGKVGLQLPSGGKRPLEALFKKVDELESRS